MKKISFFITLLYLVAVNASAQDIIYFYDGTKTEGEVLTVDEKEVSFIRKDNPGGPEYTEKKNKIVMIVYSNGTIEVFATGKGGSDPIALNFKRNYIGLVITDLASLTFTISYEHILKNGKLGLRVPIGLTLPSDPTSAGFLANADPSEGFNPNGRTFKSGLDFNFYPTGQGKVKYFVGPSFQFQTYKYYHYDYYYNGQYSSSEKSLNLGYHFAALINNGMVVQPTSNFNFSFFLGVGIGTNSTTEDDRNYYGRLSTGFMIGFKL